VLMLRYFSGASEVLINLSSSLRFLLRMMLDAAGMAWAGAGEPPAEAGPRRIEAGGIALAFLAWSRFFNDAGNECPKGAKGPCVQAALLDPDRAVAADPRKDPRNRGAWRPWLELAQCRQGLEVAHREVAQVNRVVALVLRLWQVPGAAVQVDEAELDAAGFGGELQLRSTVPGGRPDCADQFADACAGAQDDPRARNEARLQP